MSEKIEKSETIEEDFMDNVRKEIQEDREKAIPNEILKHLKSIDNNIRFFFYLIVIPTALTIVMGVFYLMATM